MTSNEPTWAAQAPDPEAVVWHPEVARRLAAKGVGSGTVATDTLLLLRLWRDGRGSMVEATYDSLAEQVAMTRTRVREAISRLEKIGVLVTATVPGGGRSKLYGVDWSALGHHATVAPGQAGETPPTAPHRSRRGQERSGAVDVPESGSPATWSDDSAAETLCLQLAAAVTAHRGSRPKVSTRWLTDMGLLLRRGPTDTEDPPPTPTEVATVIDGTFTRLAEPSPKGFCWADQVRSPGALRGHWSQLVLALRRSAPKRGTGDIVAAMNTWNSLISEDGA
ncbi:MAG: winged helix-turn-helix domain-containing protein [Rhodocyclaceae bacterium]|nr:MAG: winged helix-turn-helix domain-containing protein [Rhodocyclaceae bacterium]